MRRLGAKIAALEAALDSYERETCLGRDTNGSRAFLRGLLVDGGLARELVHETRDQHQQILDAENKGELLYDGVRGVVARYCDDPGQLNGAALLRTLSELLRHQDAEASRASECARETLCRLKEFEARVESELHGHIAWFTRIGAPNLVATSIEAARERLLGPQRRLTEDTQAPAGYDANGSPV